VRDVAARIDATITFAIIGADQGEIQ